MNWTDETFCAPTECILHGDSSFMSKSIKCIILFLINSWNELGGPFLKCQFSSVTQSCPTLCDPMDYSMPGLPVYHQFLEFAQSHVHWVSDAIQPSLPLPSPSPPTFNLAQHQCLSNESVLAFMCPKYWSFSFSHQSFQWIFRIDFL